MDRFANEIVEESPWTMIFADDIVLHGKSKKMVETKPNKIQPEQNSLFMHE